MDSAVQIRVGNQKKSTNIVKNSDNPYFNENFAFEFFANFDKFLDETITFTVFQPKKIWRKRKILGYITLDVGTVWAQTDHQFYHKWAILSSPKNDQIAGPRGYLKVDINIFSKGSAPKEPSDFREENEEIEGNLLLPEGLTVERQKANYIFKIYRGENLYKIKNHNPNKIAESLNACIEIRFAGLKGVTSIKKSTPNPVWNESIILSELFPPLCQRVKIFLGHVDAIHHKIMGVRYINLFSIANDGEYGFLPTFGPTFVHFYSYTNCGEVYAGNILMSMHTELRDDFSTNKRTVLVENIDPLNELLTFRNENVLVFASIFGVGRIEKKFDKTICFELHFGSYWSQRDFADGNKHFGMHISPEKNTSKGKYYGYLSYKNTKPCISTVANWPDFRKRLFDANLIEKTTSDLKSKLEYIENLFVNEEYGSADQEIEEKLIELFDTLSINCTKCFDIISSKNPNFGINLDKERTRLCLKELEEIIAVCKTTYNPKTKKKSFAKAQKLYKRLQVLTENPQDCWPDIYIWMVHSGKRTAVFRTPARNVVFSIVSEETGVDCAKLQTLVFKPCSQKKGTPNIACLCRVFLWVGLQRHQNECFQKLPQGFGAGGNSPPTQITSEETTFFQCRAHIFQGRFNPGGDESGLCDPFVRITIDEHTKQTSVVKKTLQPVWDQTLLFPKIVLYENKHHIKKRPPAVLVEIFDKDECCKTEFLGYVVVDPVVKLDDETYTPPLFPPKLKWHPIFRDDDESGAILMAVELLQLSSSVDFDQITDTEEVLPIPKDIKPNLVEYKMEVLFWGVRDLKKVCFLAVLKPKVVVECLSHTLPSDTISNAKKHPNFGHTIKCIVINMPEQEEYAPPLSIKMFDSRSFGRLTYVGTHMVPVQRLFYHPKIKSEQKFENPLMTQLHFEKQTLQENQENHLSGSTCVCNIPKPNNTLQLIPMGKPQMKVTDKFRAIAQKTLKVQKEKRQHHKNVLLKFLHKFCKWRANKEQNNEITEEKQQKPSEITVEDETEEFDWWTKYYASYQEETNANGDEIFRLKIFPSELELQPQFKGFSDTLSSFHLYRGKQTGDETIDEDNVIGVFKGAVRIYRMSNNLEEYINFNGTPLKNGAFDGYPTNTELKYLVRIYCVKAQGLIPKDTSGKNDAYVYITLNDKTINDRQNYVPNQTNPIFGRCFELNGVLPNDYLINIALWDYDMTSSDDLIGETKVDLENRVFTTHRATCGLANHYNSFGYNKWRDQQRPTQILDNLCNRHHLPKPVFAENSVAIGGKVFSTPPKRNIHEAENYSQELKESLALVALRRWHEVPYVGTHLVPEHVEMRSLYNPAKPGIEQGKLHLWIDIFPCSDNPPPKPIDISPRKALKYELRAIIWNTEDVILEEDDFFAGEKRSDIYVKGWLASPDESQYTDVHYRSLTGEGNFNWRFIFKFEYISAENKLVLYKKEKFFSVDETEFKIPCKLTLQVWDNDIVSKDDFLGSVSLELARLPRGSKSAKTCKLGNIEMGVPTINLFKIKRTKGWWPFVGSDKETKKQILAGKVEVEFELLTAEEAEKSPAGFAREDPQGLPKPDRPDTSFSWFRNPFKAFKYVICKQYRWKIIRCAICTLLIIMVIGWIYYFPEYTIKKLMNLL